MKTNKYTFKFLAVLIGSIGKKRYKHTVTIYAETEADARLKLYETYEHIFIYSVNGKTCKY